MWDEPITVKQRNCIKNIERNLGIKFNGLTKADATEFISEHLNESYEVGKGPVEVEQWEDIRFIAEKLPDVEFHGQTFNDAAKFIEQHLKEAWKIAKKAEDKTPLCHCYECGVGIYESHHEFINLLNSKKICYDCYMKISETDLYKEYIAKLDREKDEFLPFSMGSVEPRMHMNLHDEGFSIPSPTVNTSIIPTKPKKEGNRMLNNLKSIIGDFGKVTTGQFKLSFQGLAIRTEKAGVDNNAQYAVYDAEEHRMIDVMDFVADAEGMIYKIPAQLNQLTKGDIIIVKDKPLVVKSVNGNSIRALNPLTNNETTHKPAGNLFGIQIITKVVSMFELFQNPQSAQTSGFNPMMLMFFNNEGESKGKFDDLLPFFMMNGAQGGANSMQNMLPFLMLSGKGEGNGGMMEMMMMSQMFGAQNNATPFNFGNLFGQAPQAAPVESAEEPPAVEKQDNIEAIAKAVVELLKAQAPKESEEGPDTSAE